jgi:hypothetical protein
VNHIYRRPEQGGYFIVPLVDVDTILKSLTDGKDEGLVVPEHIKHNLEMGRLFPDVRNMKSLFEAPEAQPNLAALAAVTGGTSEVNLWTPAQWTPLPSGPGSNNYVTAGQLWELQSFGVCTYPATTPGTTAFTARVGTSGTPASNTILGAASSAVQGTTQTGVHWFLNGNWYARTIGLPGANSTTYGKFVWTCPLALQAAGSQGGVLFGGTATVDLSIANGIAISVTPSVAGQSFTPEMISWRSIG